jgi:hypothetical protein
MKTVRMGLAVLATAGLCAAQAQQGGPAVQTAAPAAAAVKTWADSITVKGDLRYRFENIDQEGADGRQRDRIRARLGATSKINDTLKGEIELSTGDKDPVSGNKTIGDGFTKKDMGLNLAYLDWAPVEGVDVIGGKMKNPFVCVGDLIWDGDLTPEGIAFNGVRTLGSATVLGNAGYLWVQERATKPEDESKVYAGQLAFKYDFSDEVYLLAGGSLYSYDNMEGFDVQDWQGKNASYGNSTTKGTLSGSTTNKAYATGFSLAEGFAKLGIWIGVPIEFYGQYVANQDADAYDTGYLYGVNIGRAKNPGTWELGWNYRELKKDAAVGAFSDSDSWGGGTDGKGHRLSAKYQIAKNLQGGVTYFMDDKTISDPKKTVDYERLQIDVVAKF